MNADKLIAAIRTINQHHNLGDAIYDVRERVTSRDPAYKGDSWQHPTVTEYSKALDTVAEEIGGWGKPTPLVPTPRNCPFCAQPPEQGEGPRGRVELGCNNADCPASPVVRAPDLATAIERWNRRDSL